MVEIAYEDQLLNLLYSGDCGDNNLEMICYWWINGNLHYFLKNMLGFAVVEIIIIMGSGAWVC